MSWPSDDVLGRSQDVFLRLTGRINRARFLGAIVVIAFVCVIAALVVAMPIIFLGHLVFPESLMSNIAVGVVLLAMVISQAFYAGPVAQRAHDLGWRAKVVLPVIAVSLLTAVADAARLLLLTAPPSPLIVMLARLVAAPGQIAFVLLLVLPGQTGENAFGPAPKPV